MTKTWFPPERLIGRLTAAVAGQETDTTTSASRRVTSAA
jgi:hypothetical protein